MTKHHVRRASRFILFFLIAAPQILAQTSIPSIFAIFPNNALSPGAQFEIRGQGLVGHDAIFLAEANGPGGLIGFVDSSSGSTLTASLDSFHLCVDNRPAQGLLCRAYTAIKPGPYFIYVINESGESNRLAVVATKSPSSFSVKEPSEPQPWKIGTEHRIAWSVPPSDRKYLCSVQSAKAWSEVHSVAPAVSGRNAITWTAGTSCGPGGCSVSLAAGEYYVVVEDEKSAIRAWSKETITLIP